MVNDIGTDVESEFSDIELNLDGMTPEILTQLMTSYIHRTFSPASVSKYLELSKTSGVSLEEAVSGAVFNEAMIDLLEDSLSNINRECSIPPFGI